MAKRKNMSATIVYQDAPTTQLLNSNAQALKEKERRNERMFIRRHDLVSIASQIAKDNLYEKNWPIPDGRKLFPVLAKLRFIDKRFPNAAGGPLLVDEPSDAQEVALCEVKRKYLNQMGLRYIVVTENSTVEDCLSQLER